MAEGPKATTSLWQRFDIAPAPTRAPESPKWPRMRSLALRQDEPASIETCAYYSFGGKLDPGVILVSLCKLRLTEHLKKTNRGW